MPTSRCGWGNSVASGRPSVPSRTWASARRGCARSSAPLSPFRTRSSRISRSRTSRGATASGTIRRSTCTTRPHQIRSATSWSRHGGCSMRTPRATPRAARPLLYAPPKVASASARIRFVGFGRASLDLEVFSYVTVTDYGEYLEVAEDLNLRLMDIVAAAGSSLVFPAQTTYVEKGRGLDPNRAQEAEAQVQEWRQR